jgi:hypothetical protein
MRAGTTTLYNHLRSHPAVFMPEAKEPNFFGANWERGVAWYEGLFAGAGGAAARGEASTAYSNAAAHREVVPRIASTIPDARFIYLIRHPIERLISQYHYATINEFTRKDIDRAVLTEGFLTRSMYAFQIERYLDRFDRDRLLVLTTDELRQRPEETVARAYDFIGVDPTWLPRESARVFHQREDVRAHRPLVAALRHSPLRRVWASILPRSARIRMRGITTRDHRSDPRALTLSDETRAIVLDRLRPDLVRLREIMGPEFQCWGLLDATSTIGETSPT